MEPSTTPGPRWRRILAPTLVVLACVLAPIAVDAVWVKNTALKTDRFVEQLAPLAQDPKVQDAVSAAVSDNLLRTVDLTKRLDEALPDNLAFLAAPLDNTLSSYVRQISHRIVTSSAFEKLWVESLTRSHTQVIKLLTGGGDRIQVDQGVVTLDLTKLRDRVVTRLDQVGLSRFIQVDTSKPVQLTLMHSTALEKGQFFVRLLRTLGWVIPLLTILVFLTALGVSIRRRRTAMWIGLGIAISMALHLAALALGHSLYLQEVTKFLPADAATAIFDLLVRAPRVGTKWLLGFGLLVGMIAVFAGPSGVAVGLRTRVGNGWRRFRKADAAEVTEPADAT